MRKHAVFIKIRPPLPVYNRMLYWMKTFFHVIISIFNRYLQKWWICSKLSWQETQWQHLMQFHKEKSTFFNLNNQMPYTLNNMSHYNTFNIIWYQKDQYLVIKTILWITHTPFFTIILSLMKIIYCFSVDLVLLQPATQDKCLPIIQAIVLFPSGWSSPVGFPLCSFVCNSP